VGCSKRPGFSPAQLWRAETRLVRRQVRSSAADPRFMFHASRFTVPLSEARTPLAAFFSILLTGITLALSACASGSEVDLTIHESERGAVYVERFPDLSFQAAHPITLSADTMARVLRGVVVQDNGAFFKNLVSGKPEAVRAFKEEDVEYLAPLLVEGLTRAASDQQVGFQVIQTGTPAEPTDALYDRRDSRKGSLYAYGRSLYLTLPWLIVESQVRAGGAVRSRTILFIPESAIRPDSYRDTRSTDATLVIDYDLLATMPAAPDMRSTAAQPATPAKGESTQRDTDLDALRKEMEDIKKKLAEQEARQTPRSIP